MERGPKSSWLCRIVKSIHVPADVLKLQTYFKKYGNVVPVVEEDTIEQFDRIIRNVFNPFEPNAANHSYLMVILNSIKFLCQKNCFADWISPNHERQPEFCTKFASLMKTALKYIAAYINVDDKNFLTLLSVFKEIILKSSEHIYLKNVFLRALSYWILKLIISAKVVFPLKKILIELMVKILEDTDRQVRSDTFHKVKSLLCMMLKSLHKYGDYRTQMAAVEIIIRFTTLVPNERVDIAKTIQNEEICQRFARFSPRNFEMECRIILNLLNQTHGQNSNVFTIACEKAFVGNYSLKKPKHEDYKELWVDFNLDSQSITICCDGDSLMCVEENQMPEHNGYWETLTVESKNIRKLNIVPRSGDSFSGNNGTSLMHLKLARPCDYVQPTSAASVNRCSEICFHFKHSPEFKDLEDRIIPQIFRGSHQEGKGSYSPYINLNVYQVRSTRGNSGQLAKNHQDSNEASLKNNKNSESCRFSSHSDEKNATAAAEKLGDDPEKQLETLQADLLKEIMQESEIVGSKHTQATNSADCSLKELYNKLAAHKFVKYSAVSPCAKEPKLSQIQEALSNGKQSITQISTQKITSNYDPIPVVEETVTANEQPASEYIVNNTSNKENQRMDAKQKNMLQKESEFCHESSGSMVTATNGKQSITQTATQKIFSNSVSIPVVQETITVNDQPASDYVVNNTSSKENRRIDDKQKNLLQKESKFCLESSGGLAAEGSLQETNSKDCADSVFLHDVKSQVYDKPASSQHDSVPMPLNSNTDVMNKHIDDVTVNVKGRENVLSAFFNVSSEQNELMLDNASLKNSDVKSSQIIHERNIHSTDSISNEDKLKSMPIQQKLVEINRAQEMTRDSSNTVSINCTKPKKSSEKLRQPSKKVGRSLKKGKLRINLQKSISDNNMKNDRFENEPQSKPDLFLKNDGAKVTNSSEKRKDTTLISSHSEIQENNSNPDQKSSENRECEEIRNISQVAQNETSTLQCKDVQDVYEKPLEQPCKNLQTVIFKTPISEAAAPLASIECNSKEKRKTKNDCLQLKNTVSDEKLLDKSENITRQMSEGDVKESQGVSSSYTLKLSQQEILVTKDKCANGVGQDIQTHDLSLSSSGSSPLFQPIKRDSHVHMGRTTGKFFTTDKNSKSIETKVTYENLPKKGNGKTEHRISGRRRLFSSETGIEIINVLFSSKKYDQEQEKKLSRTVSAKKVNIATTKIVQHDVICKNEVSSKNSGKNKNSLEISESDYSWNKVFPANTKTKSNSRNNNKKKNSKYKNITADNSNNHNFNRGKKNKVESELSDMDASWRNIFPTSSKKRCNYNSTTEVKMSKHQEQTVNVNTEKPKLKEKKASTVNSQNNSMQNNVAAEWSLLPQQVLDTERMRGDSSADEDNLVSSKDLVKEASKMFFGKKSDRSSLEDFPSLIVEKEKKSGAEPYKYFDNAERKDPLKAICPAKAICPSTNILNESSMRTKPTVVKNKSWNTELDNSFRNSSDVSSEGEDTTSKRRVDIVHSSDENESHNRNQPLLTRLWEDNCNKTDYNTQKRRRSPVQAPKWNEIQSLNKGIISPSAKSKLSIKQIPGRESAIKFGTTCINHNHKKKSHNNQSSNNVSETQASYSSDVEVVATGSPSKRTLITSTRNFNPVQNIVESSRAVKLDTICEVNKPDPGTNTVNNANTYVNHLQNADNRKNLLFSTGVNRRTTSTPYSIPGSLCFSSKTGISPIESVKNYTSRKNIGKSCVENSLSIPIGTDNYQSKHGLGTNNMKDSGCKLPSVERNKIAEDIDEISCKETKNRTKNKTEMQLKYEETNITFDSNDYSWEKMESKTSCFRKKSPTPPKDLTENHWYQLPPTSDQDQEVKRSCTGIKNKGSESEISVGKKGKKSTNFLECGSNKEMEISNNDSTEECEMYSTSLSSFTSRMNSEVSSGCHLNSDISIQSKRRRLNKLSVMQKQKDIETYSHKEKLVRGRRRETVKYRHSIIAVSQEQWKTASETANEDNENDSSCQPSEGNEVQNLLVSSLQKRMKIHKDYSDAVAKTILNAAAELTTCRQDEWQNMVKEYEEKVKNSFEKVNTMLQESISQQNELHKFLKKYSSESQKRYMTVKDEAQVISACTKKMCERLGEIVSYEEDMCSQKVQETQKLLCQEADQIIARERTRNRALVQEKVCHALTKRK